MKYFPRESASTLPDETMCICRCPNWCEIGLQIAQWNKEEGKFDYPESPNEQFDSTVIAFAPLNEDGMPLKKF